jgi:stringent starvation protein B
MDSAQAKRDFAIALLQESSLFIHLDPRREGATVPSWLKRQPQLVLQVGLNMAVRIPDLDVGDQAICCTLSFNRSPFFCYIPWSAIFGLVGEDGRGRIWPEDVPIEIASQMQQEASKEPAKGNAKSQRPAARARLQAVPASGQAAKGSKDEAVPMVPSAEVSPIRPEEIKPASEKSSASESDTNERRGSTPAPGNSKKRELPAYLRVVK